VPVPLPLIPEPVLLVLLPVFVAVPGAGCDPVAGPPSGVAQGAPWMYSSVADHVLPAPLARRSLQGAGKKQCT